MRYVFSSLSFILFVFALGPAVAWGQKSGDELSIESIRHPENLELSLWADSTQLANPVAFSIDNDGTMFVCETFRQNQGVEDNRGHMDWLDDDLAAQTLEDRLAYFKKHLGDELSQYSEKEDRVVRLLDADNDGKADQYGVFADGFNDILAGTGAGVLSHNGEVYYTCIPDLWKLTDKDGNGQAEKKESLSYGYGVRVAFRGHDSHGLIVGPDGRMYFSIGDRGYHIKTKEGKLLHDPASGAVFRCELDGSNLEVFATGLRNPQELAFDNFGNLFTGDNNSDGGDEARLVHVVEGGETGWRMFYQYLPDRGPWNREKLWHPQHEGQAAYLLPPICNFADGPSGLAFYPGTGMGKEYRNTFFLCDFRGDAAISGIRSFKFKAKGASYEMTDPQQFLWNILATDVDFGPDGAMYLTDWIEGWSGINRGRVIRVTEPEEYSAKRTKNIARLLQKDFSKDDITKLVQWLGNSDRRIRLKAQFELAKRGNVKRLRKVAESDERLFARLHAIWAIGQIARTDMSDGQRKANWAIQALLPLSEDPKGAVRAAVIQTLGDIETRDATEQITKALSDKSPRVRSLAGIAISKCKPNNVTEQLVRLLVRNGDKDPVVRHGGVMGLVGTCTVDELMMLKDHKKAAVRRAVVIALRRKESPKLAEFLNDSDPSIVHEAALAIHDVLIAEAMPQLAALVGADISGDEALLRRALNANFRLGGAENAKAVASVLGKEMYSEVMQLEALSMLEDWDNPSSRDRVLGQWRPMEKRSNYHAVAALQMAIPNVKTAPASVAIEGIRIAAAFKLAEAGNIATEMVADPEFDATKRAALLAPLSKLLPNTANDVVSSALKDESAEVRAAARTILIDLEPKKGLVELTSAIVDGTTMEKQAAIATLADLTDANSKSALQTVLKDHLVVGKLSPEVQLDAVQAARKRGLEESLATFLASMKAQPYGERQLCKVGGDATRGEDIFNGNVALSCTRCHRAGEGSPKVGPNLAGIGKTKTPDYLLESILDPNKSIAEGFGTIVVVTEDGLQKQGVLQKETPEAIQLMNAEGDKFYVMKEEIIDRKNGKSAMPEDLVKDLSLFDLRDLIAYLQSLKEPAAETQGHE